MRRHVYFVLTLGIALVSCSEAGPRTEPTAEEQSHLDAHVARIFAEVTAEDPAQLEADRQRVRDVHRIAYLVEQFRIETGSYPLADTLTGRLANVVIGEDNSIRDHDDHHLPEDELVAELRRVLGPDVDLPHDPLPGGFRSYVYTVYGRGYGTAAMLYHPVGWSEGILSRQWQYRVGSTEGADTPMLQATKLLAGGYGQSRSAQWRDPSMAGNS